MSQASVDSDGDGDVDSTTQYEYADDGTRVSETVNGTKTIFLVDNQNPTGYSQVLEEKNAAGGSSRRSPSGLMSSPNNRRRSWAARIFISSTTATAARAAWSMPLVKSSTRTVPRKCFATTPSEIASIRSTP